MISCKIIKSARLKRQNIAILKNVLWTEKRRQNQLNFWITSLGNDSVSMRSIVVRDDFCAMVCSVWIDHLIWVSNCEQTALNKFSARHILILFSNFRVTNTKYIELATFHVSQMTTCHDVQLVTKLSSNSAFQQNSKPW